MFTTVSMGAPVTPVQSPLRTESANAYTLASTSCTSATTSAPSTSRTSPRGRRSAVCSTALFSVTLMCWPANIAARRPGRSTCSASRTRAARTPPLIRFFDRSTCRSPAVKLRSSTRPGSAANQPRRSGSKDAFSSVSSAQAEVVVGSTGSLMINSLRAAAHPLGDGPSGSLLSAVGLRPTRWVRSITTRTGPSLTLGAGVTRGDAPGGATRDQFSWSAPEHPRTRR